MEEDSAGPKDGKTVEQCSKPGKTKREVMASTSAHTYDLWKKNSYAERAAIVAKANELMNLICDRRLRG